MKYLIIKEMGHEAPIIFHELLQHNEVASAYQVENIVSAGFVDFRFYPDKVEAHTYDKSVTLHLISRKEDDKIIERAFSF